MPRRDDVGGGRDEDATEAARTLAGQSPSRGSAGSREALIVLIFGLLAIGWSVLLRDVRAGLPGDTPHGVREAATSPSGAVPGHGGEE